MPKIMSNEKYLNKINNSGKNIIPIDEYIGFNVKIKYRCLICNYEFIEKPSEIGRKRWKCDGCNPNQGNLIVGKNDMWTTNPELAKLLANVEDGYKYMQRSGKKVDWKCDKCGIITKDKRIADICERGLNCISCSCGISLPERFMGNILNNLDVDYITHKSFNWSNYKVYDFFIPNINCIIETHGEQHYECSLNFNNMDNCLEVQVENDKYKEKIAKENGIKYYLQIDCRNSDLEYMKNSILHSELNVIYDLSSIDWISIYKKSLKSKMIDACNLWNNGINDIKDISKILKICPNTVRNYLKRGVDANLCDYIYRLRMISVRCLNDGNVFNSIKNAGEFYNIKNPNGIKECCDKKWKYCGKNPENDEKLRWEYVN